MNKNDRVIKERTSLEFRDMKYTDIERVKEIAKLTWENTYSSFIPLDIQKKTLKEAYSEDTMINRFEKSMMLVAEYDEYIKGYAFFSNGKYRTRQRNLCKDCLKTFNDMTN